MAELTETEGWLDSVRVERNRILQERAEIAESTRAAVLAAGKEGIPKTRIAELAGVSRQTVHEMLKEDR